MSEKKGDERASNILKTRKSTGSSSEDRRTTSASGWLNGAGAGIVLGIAVDCCSGRREERRCSGKTDGRHW